MRILGILAILAGAAAAQPQPNSATTENRKVGRIEGVVVNSVTNAPLARATVLIRSVGPGSSTGPMVMAEGFNQMVPQNSPTSGATAADGKFVIENVPEGSYIMMASRANFLLGYYSERGGPPATLVVSAGGAAKALTIKLIPFGVITGRILDAEGEPIQNIMVSILRYNYSAGRRVLMPSGMAQSNDLGEYRLPNLPPGKYFLASMQGMRFTPGAASGQRDSIPITFYPNAHEVSGASQVTVEPGAEVRGMDFRLKRVPAVVVSGKILGLPENPSMITVSLAPLDEVLSSVARMAPRSAPANGGNFALGGVIPGSYELRADYRVATGQSLFARLRVEVGSEDLKNIEVTLQPGGEISGAFRVESGTLPPNLLPRLSMMSLEGFGLPSPQTEKDLTFRAQNIPPGKYYPMMFPPQGFFIRSIKVDDRELNDLIDLRGPVKIEVLLAPGGGEISGTVEGPDGKVLEGAAVSVHPIDGGSGIRPDREKVVPVNPTGAFNIKGLPPGTYRVFAWDAVGSGEYRYEGFRKEYETRSATAKVSETGKETVQLKVISLPK